jgi:hypothetical protein
VQIAAVPELSTDRAKVEGLRSKLKRLVVMNWREPDERLAAIAGMQAQKCRSH